MSLEIDSPDIAIRADPQAVRFLAQEFRPRLQELAGLVKFNHRMRSVAENPYVITSVDIDSCDFAEVPPSGKLAPVFDGAIWQGRTGLSLCGRDSACRYEYQEGLITGDTNTCQTALSTLPDYVG